jgi:hypothetical protein
MEVSRTPRSASVSGPSWRSPRWKRAHNPVTYARPPSATILGTPDDDTRVEVEDKVMESGHVIHHVTAVLSCDPSNRAMEFGPPARIVGTTGSRVIGLTWTSSSESSSVANALVVTTTMNVRVFDVVHGCARARARWWVVWHVRRVWTPRVLTRGAVCMRRQEWGTALCA